MTDKLKLPATPGMAEASAEAAAKPEPSGNNDTASEFMEYARAAARQGDKRVQTMLDEDSAWREMIFVKIQGDKTVIQWPPVEVTGRDDLRLGHFACSIGTECAMDLIGHVRGHNKNFDGGRLMDVAEKIVKHGEWGHSEIGFFTGLGDFIAWGHIRAGIDFEAFPCDAGPAAGRTARDRRDRRLGE